MTGSLAVWWQRRWIKWVSVGAVVSVAALAWLGYRAITEWQRSAELAAQRNADAAADLLFTAITRDMRGVQSTVLAALASDANASAGRLDPNAVASAFARYPYPDVFFAMGTDSDPASITFYSRVDRPPSYLSTPIPETPFPVTRVVAPALGHRLRERIVRDLKTRKTLSAFDESFDGVDCQVVALLAYTDPARAQYAGAVGFIVNLASVRRSYFQDLTKQVGRIRGGDSGLRLTVLDAGGAVRAGASLADSGSPSSARRFPLLFFDPTLIDLDPPADLATEWWTGEAAVVDEHAMLAARTVARVTLLVASVSALFMAGGLALAARAAIERVRLTDMRSDFIAAVTHDLKTPVATIRAIAESFQRRTKVDQSTRHEYGEIVLQEVKRLTRLIDNLLAYARISDVTEIYGFRRTSLALLVRNCLKQFAFRLETSGFAVSTDLPDDLPPIWADAAALSLAVDNVLDNAIRYSNDRRVLTLRATPGARTVELEVVDAGIGIPAADIEHVGRGFFRASGTTAGGSGLGLAIAQRIVAGHSGSLSIRSEVGVGTTVGITLPIAEDVHDDAHPDC